MYIDTHTHLFVEQFNEDRESVIQRAIECGVEKMLLPNIDVSTISAMNDLAVKYPNNCYPMIGLHPGNVNENWEQDLQIIEEKLRKGNYIAVGEIGMDLYWDKTFVNEQKECFTKQVEWAKELRLPIAIHAREAFQEIFEILDEINDDRLTGVFHCFTGSVEDARKIKSFGGFKLGIGGVVTYKKAALDEVLLEIPINELILETDSPYLAPVPHRGKRNESSFLLHIAEKLSDIYNVPLTEIEEITTRNALELFNLPV